MDRFTRGHWERLFLELQAHLEERLSPKELEWVTTHREEIRRDLERLMEIRIREKARS